MRHDIKAVGRRDADCVVVANHAAGIDGVVIDVGDGEGVVGSAGSHDGRAGGDGGEDWLHLDSADIDVAVDAIEIAAALIGGEVAQQNSPSSSIDERTVFCGEHGLSGSAVVSQCV